jgi:hypothetical protein
MEQDRSAAGAPVQVAEAAAGLEAAEAVDAEAASLWGQAETASARTAASRFRTFAAHRAISASARTAEQP